MLGPIVRVRLPGSPIRQGGKPLCSSHPLLPSFRTLRLSFSFAPSLDDMHFSNILRLSALFATVAVQVTAVEYNVTVGGSAGLVFTPESVVSDTRCSVYDLR